MPSSVRSLPDIAVFWAGPAPQTRVDVFIAKLDFERAVLATARVEAILEARHIAGDELDWQFLEKWAREWGIADRLEGLRRKA